MENKTREAIRFEGSVQGVGFRYRMSQLARHYDVTGWVRNEYDGSVSAELQGRREAIDEIIARLRLQNGVEEGNILYRKTAVRMRTHRP